MIHIDSLAWQIGTLKSMKS